MSDFNTLLHGEAGEAAEILGRGETTETGLRAALTNALNRISNLEGQIAKVFVIAKAGEDEEDEKKRAAFIAGYHACYAEHVDPDCYEYESQVEAEALTLWNAENDET